jgi:hypothetical protein
MQSQSQSQFVQEPPYTSPRPISDSAPMPLPPLGDAVVINCKAHISLNSAIWIEYYPCSAGVSSLTVQPMVTASQTGTQGAPARSLPFPPAGMNVSQLPPIYSSFPTSPKHCILSRSPTTLPNPNTTSYNPGS